MNSVLLSMCLALVSSTAFAVSPLQGVWQGPCVAKEDKSFNQVIKYHAYTDTTGLMTVTNTKYVDAHCHDEVFYQTMRLDVVLRASELGDGILEIDGSSKTNDKMRAYDIVKFSEANGFRYATLGEVMGTEASKRPAVFSTRDRVYFKVTN